MSTFENKRVLTEWEPFKAKSALRTAQLRRSFRHDSIMKLPLASLCALCLLSVAPPLHAQGAQAAQPASTPVPAVLSLSHATGALSFALPGEPARRVEPGDTLAVPAGVPVVVQVTDTNTALSQYSLTAEKGDAPQLVPLNRFLSALAPYFVDVPSAQTKALGQDESQPSPALRDIDDAVFGPAGVHLTYLAIEDALRKMSKGPDAILGAAELLKASLAPGWDTNVDRLLRAYARLGSTAAERKALKDSAGVLEAARRVEALAKAVLSARPEYRFPPFDLAWNESRSLKLRAAPTRDSTLSDFATLPARDADVKLAPLWPLDVGLGASLLFSPDSTWQGPSGIQDGRFTWGLTLSLAPRALTPASLRANGWALWLPELTLNPSTSDRALGLGAAVGWKALKLGAGALWTRHETPAGDQTYGSPKPYVSLSVTGWEPFKAK
jgi:hypothetical protein